MDKAKGGSVHQGNSRTKRAQQADSRSLHERVIKEVEVCPVKVFALEVVCEALDQDLSQQGVGKEIDGEETRHQVFALVESPLVLRDERSS